MKAVVLIIVVVLVAASIFADYKWRRWIADRRAAREQSGDREKQGG